MRSRSVPDLYLVCAPDFDWVQDGTRESAAYRESMHESLTGRAASSSAQVIYLRGPHRARLEAALDVVGPLTCFSELV